MKKISIKSVITIILFFINPLCAKADYIHQTLAEYSGTIMEVHINQKQLKVILEIDEKDKKFFSYLLDKKQNSLIKQGLLKTNQQQSLIGKIETIETRQRIPRGNRQALPTTDVMGKPLNLPQISLNVTYVEIIYPLKDKPTQLILSPPLDANQKYAATTIGFITFHEQIPITNYWYLSRPEILNINWDDPWYSKFENPNLTRPHPSSLLSYLYIEPYEVRNEILIRIRDLADFIQFDLTNIKYITPEILEQIKKEAINYFQSQPETTIDNQIVTPIIEKINFLETDQKGVFQVIQNPQELGLNSAIIGIELIYPVKQIPEQVRVNWGMFNQKITTIPTITTDPAGPFPYILTPDDQVLVWKNSLNNYITPEVKYIATSNQFNLPLGLIICIISSIFSLIIISKNKQHKKSFNNLYYGLPIIILLAGFVLNPLSKIKKANSSSQKNQAYRTKWIASGTLEHWGHRHNRQNQYEAILTISPVNNNWKIMDIELLEETRIK